MAGSLPGLIYIGGPPPCVRLSALSPTAGSPVPRRRDACVFVPKARRMGGMVLDGCLCLEMYGEVERCLQAGVQVGMEPVPSGIRPC